MALKKSKKNNYKYNKDYQNYNQPQYYNQNYNQGYGQDQYYDQYYNHGQYQDQYYNQDYNHGYEQNQYYQQPIEQKQANIQKNNKPKKKTNNKNKQTAANSNIKHHVVGKTPRYNPSTYTPITSSSSAYNTPNYRFPQFTPKYNYEKNSSLMDNVPLIQRLAKSGALKGLKLKSSGRIAPISKKDLQNLLIFKLLRNSLNKKSHIENNYVPIGGLPYYPSFFPMTAQQPPVIVVPTGGNGWGNGYGSGPYQGNAGYSVDTANDIKEYIYNQTQNYKTAYESNMDYISKEFDYLNQGIDDIRNKITK